MQKMKLIIVNNPEPGVVVPVEKAESGERTWKTLLDAKLIPYDNNGEFNEAAENYCKKLCAIIGKDETGKENTWKVCAHFKWEPNTLRQLNIRLHGRLLEELNGFCGENIKLKLQGSLSRHVEGVSVTIPFKTHPMPVYSYSNCDEALDEKGCWEFNHAVEAYCDETDANVSNSVLGLWYDESGKTEFVEVTARFIWFKVEDDFVNTPDGGGSQLDADKYRRCVLKTIMRQDVSSDISIVVDDGSKMQAHKCFLIAHSRVFAEMLQQYTFGRMKLRDISEECVNALLEFIYTFEISQAGKCSKVAVELFVAANKYEMYNLQEKVTKMLLKRRNEWFDVTATVELFLFVRKLGRTSTNDELKSKIGQVLKSKGKILIMESEGYQKLVVDDVNASTELCTAMANAD
ncbi:unnamed protein product [Orchesella dallaii]|uniref:BTB domain-containing protein n=1 Tax=Orchesella dallaii TaxID=48710 RepID=A0ABP1RNT9_9HEXA